MHIEPKIFHIYPMYGDFKAHWATTWMHIELNLNFKAMHADHTKQHDDLFRALNLKKKPCKSMFEERRRVRHKYLYKRPQKDYSQCSQHFNFKSMNDALCVALQYGYQIMAITVNTIKKSFIINVAAITNVKINVIHARDV
eukprot:500491_1